MECTVGELLKEKAGNMTRWLQEAGNPVDLDLGRLSQMQITALAQHLHSEHSETIELRSFARLLKVKENVPAELLMSVSFVSKRPDLHDKFWRYLALFSEYGM